MLSQNNECPNQTRLVFKSEAFNLFLSFADSVSWQTLKVHRRSGRAQASSVVPQLTGQNHQHYDSGKYKSNAQHVYLRQLSFTRLVFHNEESLEDRAAQKANQERS
ncbi:hypothetical protein BaRGS_00016182 [Batillaria attramentaria]|uniref:Uncharacterized protein n=1 Tax=Batillaria attramentaria TaxID=370345 RepID=A0ABD0KZS4_9CAEN